MHSVNIRTVAVDSAKALSEMIMLAQKALLEEDFQD